MKRKQLIGILCVVFASACYGVTPILSNCALRGGLPADFCARVFGGSLAAICTADPARAISNETLVALSMLLACLISLFSCLLARKKLRVSGRQLFSLSVLGGGGLAGTLLLITYAYLRIPAGMTIVINFTYPVFVMLAGILFFHEKPRIVVFLALLLAIAGIALISSSGFAGGADALGILIAVASGIVYAVYFLAGRNSSYSTLDSAVSNVYITGAASLIAFVIALVTRRFTLPRDVFIWFVLLFEAALGYIIGLRLLLTGIRLLGSTAASALNTLEPAFASLTSMLVFGEAMGFLKGLGVVFVLIGALVSILALRKKPKSA